MTTARTKKVDADAAASAAAAPAVAAPVKAAPVKKAKAAPGTKKESEHPTYKVPYRNTHPAWPGSARLDLTLLNTIIALRLPPLFSPF